MRHNRKARSLTEAALLLLAMILFPISAYGQSKAADAEVADAAVRKLSLLSELQGLEARAKRLEKPLARAMAEAEIADALWVLDRDEAQNLLREGYDLTFPSEEVRSKLRKIPVGAQPRFPSQADWARSAVSRRVLQVAGRDKVFVAELVKSGTDQLGHYETYMEYASLASEALTLGDKEDAGRYILEAIDADPTQIGVLSAIQELATRDRAAADSIILQYLQRLSGTSLSFRDGSVERSEYLLAKLIWPYINVNADSKVAPPSPAVMRAYVAYMLNSIGRLEQENPGSGSHGWLLAIWPLLKQYAPELAQQFLDLEQRTRKPGENFSLPTRKRMEEESKASYEKRIRQELEQKQPDENMIRSAISYGDFAKARKMIDKWDDGPRKAQLNEMVDAEEAISLANKGDIAGARELAGKLSKATSILRVFPVIAGKCVTKKDDTCARDSVDQAIKQLKQADATPDAPPPGIPVSIIGTKREFDPVLAILGSLAAAVVSAKDELALDVLDGLVISANHSELDTGQGRTGFETSLFKKLAEKNEAHVNLAAMQLQDPLRQIVALAAIDQWKSDKLVAEAKRRSTVNESSVKKN
jgi:hypothetical protein